MEGWDETTWRINVNSPTGRTQLMFIEQITGGGLSTKIKPDELIVTIDQHKLQARERQLRTTLRTMFARMFPEVAAQSAKRFGMRVWTAKQTTTAPAGNVLSPEVVVLIHGIDDPGKVWNVLRPTLIDEGYTVCQFEYPNDQPIADSATMFARALVELRTAGVKRISIVAHSMGGLVTRDVLTRPGYYAGQCKGHTDYPDVARFIMIGTPNQGAPIARLRLTAEIREQIERAFNGDWNPLDSIFDGAGEAKIDLLPGSEFLSDLNARPIPKDVAITIIAGDTSPVTSGKVKELTESLKEQHPGQMSETADDIAEALDDLVAGLGDGCVPVKSTYLTGVDDHTIVPGNHLTIIRNFSIDDDRVPPAVPIVLDRLKSATAKQK
jgi:pimeloyl-ACP methyl ester carboxylesterase